MAHRIGKAAHSTTPCSFWGKVNRGRWRVPSISPDPFHSGGMRLAVPTLIEAELFVFKGAFTGGGAVQSRDGLLADRRGRHGISG